MREMHAIISIPRHTNLNRVTNLNNRRSDKRSPIKKNTQTRYISQIIKDAGVTSYKELKGSKQRKNKEKTLIGNKIAINQSSN